MTNWTRHHKNIQGCKREKHNGGIVFTGHADFPKIPCIFYKESATRYATNHNLELFNKGRIRNKTDIIKKPRETKNRIPREMEKI